MAESCEKSGFYYLRVKEFNDTPAGSFKVKATQTGGSRDVGGSSRGTALTLSTNELTGRYVAGDLDSSTDEDWFKVTLGEQEHVTFHTFDGSADTVIELYDDGTNGYAEISDATRRWMRKDDDGAVPSLMSAKHFCAPRAGDYYVRVTGYGGSTGNYTIYAQQMGNSATAYPAWP